MNMNRKAYADFIASYSRFCKKAGMRSYSDIFDFIRHEVKEEFKSKGKDKHEINYFAERSAKDICKRLNIEVKEG